MLTVPPPGSAAMRPEVNARLVAVAAAGLLAGVGAAWIVSRAGPGLPVVPVVPLALLVALLIGWSFIGSGLLGFDRATTPMGTGVQGMSDRLSALGGTLEITSAPGQGTRVTGRVPALATGRAG